MWCTRSTKYFYFFLFWFNFNFLFFYMLIQLDVAHHLFNCSIFVLKLTPQFASKMARIHARSSRCSMQKFGILCKIALRKQKSYFANNASYCEQCSYFIAQTRKTTAMMMVTTIVLYSRASRTCTRLIWREAKRNEVSRFHDVNVPSLYLRISQFKLPSRCLQSYRFLITLLLLSSSYFLLSFLDISRDAT